MTNDGFNDGFYAIDVGKVSSLWEVSCHVDVCRSTPSPDLQDLDC